VRDDPEAQASTTRRYKAALPCDRAALQRRRRPTVYFLEALVTASARRASPVRAGCGGMTRVEKPFVSSDKEHGLMCGTDDGVDVMHPRWLPPAGKHTAPSADLEGLWRAHMLFPANN